MWLPMNGDDLSQYFHDKNNDKWLVTKLKKKYDVIKENKTYVISTINDKATWVASNLLAMKMVKKNHPNQCTSGVIACAKGVQMNRSFFLLN